MLNNRKETKFKPNFAKKASHGIQNASVKTVEINTDKNDNSFLNIILTCDTGEYNHRILKPLKPMFMPYGAEVDMNGYTESLDTVYWESCDKLLDDVYNFIRLFDVNTDIDENGYITDKFLTAYRDFIDTLKYGTVTVDKNNYRDLGFKKARRKLEKVSKAGNNYTSYDLRIVGEEKDTWAEDTGKPAYVYTDMLGEKIADFESTDFWNSFFEFIFKYFMDLKKRGLLEKQFVAKLIRVESPEYEKDADGKALKIDGKRVIKTMYYNVGTPQSMWFKTLDNERFDLKFSKSELEVIHKYEALKNADSNTEIEDDLPM